MEWLNEPASWQRNGDVLRVNVDPGTDFWRGTGYGYVHDNGHVYGVRLPGDLDVSVRVRGAFASQYDQAGIMLRADEETWLKTGLEFFDGRPRLSTVLTMGWSSWMVADLPPGSDEVTMRVSRRGEAVEVRYAAGDGAAELAALVFMPPDREMLAGIVGAAPEGTGFSVTFHDLRVVGREWGGQEVADGAAWAGEPAARAAGAGAGWAGEAAAWEDEQAGDGAAGWPGDTDRAAEPGWAGDRSGDRAAGWAAEASDAEAADWAGDRPGEPGPPWDADKSRETVPGSALDEPGEAAGGWDAVEGAESEPGRAEERPAKKQAARKQAARKQAARKRATGVPDGWDDELPDDESLDWAKPQASEPAADWDRLSLSLSSTSWNAFAAARPAEEQPGEPGREQPGEPDQEPPGKPSAGPAGQADRDREDSAGQQPEPPPGDRTEPDLTSADPAGGAEADHPAQAAKADDPVEAAKADDPAEAAKADDPAEAAKADETADTAEADETADTAEAAKPDDPARGKNARGKNKAKVPVPPALPSPADPADEWISLLTADSAEELSGPGPAGELSGTTADEPGPA